MTDKRYLAITLAVALVMTLVLLTPTAATAMRVSAPPASISLHVALQPAAAPAATSAQATAKAAPAPAAAAQPAQRKAALASKPSAQGKATPRQLQPAPQPRAAPRHAEMAALIPTAPATAVAATPKPVAAKGEPLASEVKPVARPALPQPPTPRYPKLARSRGWQGVVWLEVAFGADGQLLSSDVVDSSGYPLLDQAALDALRDWRLSGDALQLASNGQYRARLPVRFALNDGATP